MTWQVSIVLAAPAFTVWLLVPSTVETYLSLIVYSVVAGLCVKAIGARSPCFVDRSAAFLDSNIIFALVVAIEVTLIALLLGLVTDQSQTFLVKALAFGVLFGVSLFVIAIISEWYESV
jgi:hypothetical protein